MKRARISGIFLLVLASLAAFGYMNYYESETVMLGRAECREEWTEARPDVALQDGDIVFRHARGTISNMFLAFSRRDPRYSHAGVVAIEKGAVYVYHALGGEGSNGRGIRRERLEDFCSPAQVHAFGLYRMPLDEKQRRSVLAIVHRWYAERLPYDVHYDLATDSAMYCTEFVYKALAAAHAPAECLHLSRLPGLEYVACDDLYCQPHVHLLYAYTYRDE